MDISFFRKKLKTLNRVELFSENIKENISVIAKIANGKHIFPVLKSNAYGHGLKEIVKILKSFSFPYLAVDSYYEALQIWEGGKHPVLIMGPNMAENISFFQFQNLAVGVSNFEVLRALAEQNNPIKIHLCVNTGMNREGFSENDIGKVLSFLKKHPKLKFEGVFSHFADADGNTEDCNRKQESSFSQVQDSIFREGFSPKYIHLGNSAGCGKTKERRINSVRPGIAMYGYNPLLSHDPHFSDYQELKPALRLISTITNIQHLKKGDSVSYNGTFTAEKEMDAGLIPVGYFEALDRRLSNKGFFKYQNTFLPILGKVCMNLTSFGTEGLPLKVGDEVVIISEKPEDKNSVQNIANQIGTIPYEVLTRVERSVRREVI